MDLDISVFTSLKDGLNKIKTNNGILNIFLKNGKISYIQFEEKIIKESKELIINLDEEEIDSVEETLSDEEKELNDSNLLNSNFENISFGSTNLSGLIETEKIINDKELIEEIEPISQVLSDDEEIVVMEKINENLSSFINQNKEPNLTTINEELMDIDDDKNDKDYNDEENKEEETEETIW